MTQLRQAGYTGKVLGNSGASAGNLEPAGDDGAGMVWPVDFDCQQEAPSSQQFVKDYTGGVRRGAAELRRRGLRRCVVPGRSIKEAGGADRDGIKDGMTTVAGRPSTVPSAASLPGRTATIEVPGVVVEWDGTGAKLLYAAHLAASRRTRMHGAVGASGAHRPAPPDQQRQEGDMQDSSTALSLGSIYLLFALGMSLTWGTIDILNFAHGSIFMFSTFTAYLVAGSALPFLLVVLHRRGRRRAHVPADPGARVRADHQTGARQTQCRDADPDRRHRRRDRSRWRSRSTTPRATPSGLRVVVPVTMALGDLCITNVAVHTIILAARPGAGDRAVAAPLPQGLALRAIGVDAEIACAHGRRPPPARPVTMAVSGGLAGLAGVMFTYYLGAITPESGDTLLVKAFAMHHPRRCRQHVPASRSARSSSRSPRSRAQPHQRLRGSTPSRSA